MEVAGFVNCEVLPINEVGEVTPPVELCFPDNAWDLVFGKLGGTQ